MIVPPKHFREKWFSKRKGSRVSLDCAGVIRKYAPAGIPQGDPFFWVLDGGSATAGAFAFGGLTGDQSVSGDWLGTGTARAGVYRNGLWILDAKRPP
jgi:hypothetical protein